MHHKLNIMPKDYIILLTISCLFIAYHILLFDHTPSEKQ